MKVFIKGKEETVRLKFRSTHVTYHDNPYVTPQRIAFHESLKVTNPYWYRVFTEGLFGNKLNESPYAFAFNRASQVSDGIRIPHPVLNRAHPVILSWDFNRNPMSCLVIQNYDMKAMVLEAIRIPNSGVDAMCEHILAKYPGCLFLVTGDYNGDNTSSLYEEQVTHYLLIKKYLKLSENQIKIKPNPKQAKNSTHVNTVLSYYEVIIHGVNAKGLVFDLENVKRRADGTILKADRDKAEQQSDLLDCFRYFVNLFLDGYKPTDEMIMAKAKQGAILQPEVSGVYHLKIFADAMKAINSGSLIICTKEDYHNLLRNYILEYAGKLVDNKDGVRAAIALEEVKRLDARFNVNL